MGARRQVPPIEYSGAKQADLTAAEPHCPTCGRPWAGLAVKVCRRCGEPIRRHEKHRVVAVGPGVFSYLHRECPKAGGG